MTHDLEQFKLDRETTAWRIMRVMIIGGALSWTRERLVWEIMEEDSMIQAALAWLLKQSFVQRRGERWWKTRDGEDAYSEQARSKHFRTGLSDHEFRLEALTGMDARGNETGLTTAALPSSSTPYTCNPEEIMVTTQCARVSRIRKIAIEAGITVKEAADGLRDGTVYQCNGINGVCTHEPGKWSKFYPHKSSRHQRQSGCIECWKEMMRQRRAK